MRDHRLDGRIRFSDEMAEKYDSFHLLLLHTARKPAESGNSLANATEVRNNDPYCWLEDIAEITVVTWLDMSSFGRMLLIRLVDETC